MRLNELYRTYKNEVDMFVVYIREAHPDDGWRVPANLRDNIHVNEPTSDEERTAVASTCQIGLELQMPMLIDSIDNDVEEKYVSIPMRLFLIDREGKIVYAGNRGPAGFDMVSWEAEIKAQLALA